MPHLERHGHDRAGVVGQRRLRHHDVVIAVGQAVDDLSRGLLAGEIEEELLDVLNLEGALLEAVLFQEVIHGETVIIAGFRLWAYGQSR